MARPACLAVLILLLATVGCGRPESNLPPPWEVQPLADGTSRALGVHLGGDDFRTLRQAYGLNYEIGLFEEPDRPPGLEAYFRRTRPGGYDGELLVTLELPAETLEQIRDDSPQQRKLPSGARRYRLSDQGLELAMEAVVAGLTFLPYVNLDGQVLQKRFGQPQRVVPAADGAEHWLYPQLGLDVVLSTAGRAALQYVAPRDFRRLSGPLGVAEEIAADTDSGGA